MKVKYLPTIKNQKTHGKKRADRLVSGLRERWRQRGLYFLVLPAIVLVFVFNYIPMYGVTLAFRNFNAAKGPFLSPWAKPLFYNFWFLRDPEFWYVLGNTIKISLFKFIAGFPAPIMLALLINEVRNRTYKRVVQTVTYLPHFISWVIMAGIIYRVFDLDPHSPWNALRALLGAGPKEILASPRFFLPLVVFSNMFKEIGWGTIIYLAAMMYVDPQLYEAAYIDGAGKIRQTWSITLPCILPVVTILFILWVPSILTENLNQIYNLMNSMTRRAASITDIYVLTQGIIKGHYAYAAAMGLLFSVWGLVLTIAVNKVFTDGGTRFRPTARHSVIAARMAMTVGSSNFCWRKAIRGFDYFHATPTIPLSIRAHHRQKRFGDHRQ